MSNRLQVKKNRRFPSFFRLDVPLFWRFAAEVGVTNGTSLSVGLSTGLQQLVTARQGRYDPLWSHFLS
jgi:hypothetical protein